MSRLHCVVAYSFSCAVVRLLPWSLPHPVGLGLLLPPLNMTHSYKNLLQELVQKEGFSLSSYITKSSGKDHNPTFVAWVKVKGEVFPGKEANQETGRDECSKGGSFILKRTKRSSEDGEEA
ncbi:hypothetical protein HN51_053393 [Arachis hypogaea]